VCEIVFHLQVRDPATWQPTSGTCFLCWGALTVGQRVKVRWLSERTIDAHPAIAVGDTATIDEVRTSTPDGVEDEYLVAAEAWTAVLLRKELHRVIGDARPAPAI
jgi:hypothetical protein